MGFIEEFEKQYDTALFSPNQMWVNAFQGELHNNILRFVNNNGEVAFTDLVKECVMYSCDMGIHFYKTGGFPSLPKGILRSIVKSVCVAMQNNFPTFGDSYHLEVLEKVEGKLANTLLYGKVQEEVDRYYHRI